MNAGLQTVCIETGRRDIEAGTCPVHRGDACLYTYEGIRERCLHLERRLASEQNRRIIAESNLDRLRTQP